jgi:hypothetical protein
MRASAPRQARRWAPLVDKLAIAAAALQFLDYLVDASPKPRLNRIAFHEERSDALSDPEGGTVAMPVDQGIRQTPDVGIELRHAQ